jgi:hypothetical protein
MISPDTIREHARKLWATGKPLRSLLNDEPAFPRPVPFRKPSAQEWLDHFGELHAWVERLEADSKARVGSGYSLRYRELAHRKVGRLRVPEIIEFETVEDLAQSIGEVNALRRFQALASTLRASEPRLMDWLAAHPLIAVEHAASFSRLLAVSSYLQEHPRPMRYARELDIPGVDSKFIEEHQALLREWLDRLLSAEAVDTTVKGLAQNGFERRYGLRCEDPVIRFRWLDGRYALAGGITEATVPMPQFVAYTPPCSRVYVTENKISFLTLPEANDALAIFGGGYAIDRLGGVPWLQERMVYYWGDIDTHGFAILSRLRRYWPHVRSFLMDRNTLMAHRDFWGEEPQPHRSLEDLKGLQVEEQLLYGDLRDNRLGVNVRLEQERIGFAYVCRAVKSVTKEPNDA